MESILRVTVENFERGNLEVGTTPKLIQNNESIGAMENCGENFLFGPEGEKINVRAEGLKEKGGHLSFDSAYKIATLRKVSMKASTKKKLKNRKLEDLGAMAVVKPSYYASIAPRQSVKEILADLSASEFEEDLISNGTFNPCSSHIDSEVIRCNNRLLAPSKLDVGRKIWRTITRLGVSFGGCEDIGIEKVDKLEKRDMEEGRVLKGLKKGIL